MVLQVPLTFLEGRESLTPEEKQRPVDRVECLQERAWVTNFSHFSKPLKVDDTEEPLVGRTWVAQPSVSSMTGLPLFPRLHLQAVTEGKEHGQGLAEML